MNTTTSKTLITISREDAVRMVGMAHHGYEWEVAEFMTRLAMQFGPAPLDEAAEDSIVLDLLTTPAGSKWVVGRVFDLHAEHESRYPAAA